MLSLLGNLIRWLNDQPAGTQAVVVTLFAFAVGFLPSVFRYGWAGMQSLRRWRAERAARYRLGLYDHDARLPRVWARVDRARAGVFGALLKVGSTARFHPSDKAYRPEALDTVERSVSRGVRQMESASREFKGAIEDLHAATNMLFSRAAPDDVLARAVRAIGDGDPAAFKQKVEEEILRLKMEWLSLALFRGKRRSLDAKLLRYSKAIETVLMVSFQLVEVCGWAVEARDKSLRD
jgi:hypothetical protein